MTFFRHGQHRFIRITAGGAGLFCLLALVGLGLCLKNDNKADNANEQCIQCHMGMWNKAIALPSQHLPFLDRQCTVCHLEVISAVSVVQVEGGAATLFTGSAVNQGPQWAKRQVFKGPVDLTGGQRFVLSGLQAAARYRFRVVSEDAAAPANQARTITPWLGLLPQEVLSGGQIDCQTLSLSRAADGEVQVAWHGAAGVRGWVEVEEFGKGGMEPAADLAQPAGAPTVAAGAATKEPGGGHPLMRSPAETAIEVCYSCHPQSALGTSHPVRIYSHGEDTRIPDELPTVENGMITCVTCHNPHAAVGKQLVREKVETKLCVACHINFQGSSLSTIF